MSRTKPSRDRCPTCGRLTVESAEARARRALFRLLPEDTHERVGQILNLGYLAADTGSLTAVLLLAFDRLRADLEAQGHVIA